MPYLYLCITSIASTEGAHLKLRKAPPNAGHNITHLSSNAADRYASNIGAAFLVHRGLYRSSLKKDLAKYLRFGKWQALLFGYNTKKTPKSKDFPRKMQYTECGTSKYEYICCHVAYVKPRKTNANANTHPPKKKAKAAKKIGTQVLSYFIVWSGKKQRGEKKVLVVSLKQRKWHWKQNYWKAFATKKEKITMFVFSLCSQNFCDNNVCVYRPNGHPVTRSKEKNSM